MNSSNSIQRNRPHPITRTAFAAWKWLVVIPVLGLSTLIVGTTVAILSLVGLPEFASRVFATRWARLNMAVSMIGIDIIGQDKVDPHQSYVIVANHQSLIDIYVLYGYAGLDIKWVMKQELRTVPVIGIACDLMGHIYIDRSDAEAAVASINRARDKICNGISVVFFPEGTRSRTGELRHFKKGAFRLASELGLPILPIAIHDTNKVLPSDTMDLQPGRVKVEFLDPVPADAIANKDVGVVAREARELIRRSLEQD